MNKVDLKYELKFAKIDLDRAERRIDKAQDLTDMIYFKNELKIQQEYVDRIVARMVELGVDPEDKNIWQNGRGFAPYYNYFK